MSMRRSAKSPKRQHVQRARVKDGQNGQVDIVSAATASEIRKTLRIGHTQIRNILRAFDAAGVKV